MATQQDVADFLTDLKSAIRAGLYILVPRTKNTQGLVDLGFNDIEEAEPVLLGITPRDYCEGPESDRDRPDSVIWVFGAKVGNVEAYIKVKLLEDRRSGVGFRAKVLAFHPAERPLRYPLRGGGV